MIKPGRGEQLGLPDALDSRFGHGVVLRELEQSENGATIKVCQESTLLRLLEPEGRAKKVAEIIRACVALGDTGLTGKNGRQEGWEMGCPRRWTYSPVDKCQGGLFSVTLLNQAYGQLKLVLVFIRRKWPGCPCYTRPCQQRVALCNGSAAPPHPTPAF